MNFKLKFRKTHSGINKIFLFFALSFAVLAVFLAAVMLPALRGKEYVTLPIVSDYEAVPVPERKDLKLGVVPGPYGDMFTETILPSLEKKGYTVGLVYFDNYDSPNIALAQDEIDMNMFQHYTYLNNFKVENDLALSAITEIPTVSMGVFSHKYASVDDFKSGITVSIPDDSTNLARALRVLESAGIITLDPSIDKIKATVDDIISNPLNIHITPIEAHNLVNSLESCDAAVINGNYAMSGGLGISDALYKEVLAVNYLNVIAVRTEDLNRQFVRDIIDTVHLDAFRHLILDKEGKYAQFQRPHNFYDEL